MGPASGSFIVALSKSFEGVFADSGQHEETRFFVDLLHLLHQTFINHGSHGIENVEAEISFGVAHRFHAFQRASAGKHGKSSKEHLFSAIEQAITPVHGVAKSL